MFIHKIVIIFSATVVFSTILVALILRLSHHKSWYDHIDHRKIHSGDVPRLGGIGFSLAFIITAIILIFATWHLEAIIRFLPCLIGIFIIVVFGTWDDFRPMKSYVKLLIQVFAALCVVIPGYMFRQVTYFDLPFMDNIHWLRAPVTVLWILGLTNAINLIDGVDGLAGGISALIAMAFGIIFYCFGGTFFAVIICTGIVGAITGFLVFNAPIPKAKIFMGDGGSQFLGFTLALLPLIDRSHSTASLPLMYAAALLVIPIFDTTAAVWRRIRDKQPIDSPDKAHIHHKLMNLGLNSRQIDAALFGLQLLVCALVFISASLRDRGVLSLIILGIAYLSALAFFTVLHVLNRKAVTVARKNEHSA